MTTSTTGVKREHTLQCLDKLASCRRIWARAFVWSVVPLRTEATMPNSHAKLQNWLAPLPFDARVGPLCPNNEVKGRNQRRWIVDVRRAILALWAVALGVNEKPDTFVLSAKAVVIM